MIDELIGQAFDALWNKSSEHNLERGQLGIMQGGIVVFDVPGKPGFKYVSKGNAGDNGNLIARDGIGVAHVDFQNIKLRREFGQLVIRQAEYVATGTGGGTDSFFDLVDVQATGWDNGEIPVWNTALGKLVPTAPAVGTVYSAGNGIDITTGVISVKPAANAGLTFSSSAILVNVGNGLTLAGNQVLASLSPTGGLTFVGSTIAIKRQTNSGIDMDADGIALSDSVAGNGLGINASKQMNVNVSNGLEIVSDAVRVNQNFAFTWTGQHIFRVDPQIDANLDFIGAANREITALNSLTIKPAAELIFDPGTLITYPSSQESKMVGALDSVSGIKGFRLWDYSSLGTANTMMLTITAIKADEIFVRKFTADEARVRRGEWFLAYSYGDVQTDFTMPAINATVDVWFEEAPGLGSLAIFQGNDWVKLRTVDMTSVNLATSVWFQVVAVGANGYINRLNADAANNIPSRQQWRLVRRQGGATSQVVKRGETMVDFGVVGQGMIEMSALDESGGPFIRTALFDSVVSQVPNFKSRVQMGRLSGTVDYSTNVRWGFAAGNDLTLTPAFGFSGVTIDDVAGARFFNTDIRLYESSIMATFISRTYGMAILNDTAMFAHNLRNIAWYDNLPADGNLSGSFATAKIGTWGSTNDRRLHLNSYGSDLSGIFLQATGDNGAETTSLSVKAGGWYGLVGGIVEILSQYVTNVTPDVLGNQRPRFRVGGDSGSVARTNFHVYVDDGGQLDTTGMMMEQAGAGDTSFHWKLTNGQQFVAGIDHTNGHWKLRAGNTLRGGLASIDIDPATGVVTINGLSGSGTGTLTATGDDGIDLIGTSINVDATVVRGWRSIGTLPGGGLQGGGDLSADRVLSVDTTVVRTTRAIIADGAIGGGGTLGSDVHISLELAANSGLNQTAGLALDAWAAGNGLTFSGGKLNVGGGYGIVISADGIAVDPSILGSGGGGGSDYAAGDGLVRTGAAPNYTLDIGQGAGIIVDFDAVWLDNAYVLSTVLAGRTLNVGPGITGGGTLNNNVSFALDNAYVLSTTLAGRTITAGDGLVGTGTLANNITIDFKGGTGLVVTADLVKLDDAYVLSTVLAGRTITAGDGLTGTNTLNNNITLNVVGIEGITATADAIKVDLAYAFNWTGAHTWASTVSFGGAATFLAAVTFTPSVGVVQFNTIPQVNANLNFMGGDRAITTSSTFNLSLAPGGDIILAPTGADPDVLPGGSSLVDLGDYNRKWRSFYASEMIVQNIVSADVMATVGGNVRVGPTSVLIAPMLIGATTIDLKHNSFAQYTYLILETVSGASALPQTETIRITSTTPTTITGGYRYTVTRNATGAGGATGGAGGEKDWQAGDAVFSLGRVENNGYVDIASVDTVMGHVGPTVTVYARKADPVPASPITSQTWNNLKPVVAMGNLSSFAGVSGTKFGFAVATDLTLTPATGLQGLVATTDGIGLFNTSILMSQSGNTVLQITPDFGIALEATATVGGPLARLNRIEWYQDLATASSDTPLSFIQTTPKDASNDTTLVMIAGSGAGPQLFDGIIVLRTHRETGRYFQLTLDVDFSLVDNGVTIMNAGDTAGLEFNRPVKMTGATGSEIQLNINRAAGQPSIQGWADWLIMDGHRPASGNVGLNYYSAGDVILANGGGKVGVGIDVPAAKLHVVGGAAETLFRADAGAGSLFRVQGDGNTLVTGNLHFSGGMYRGAGYMLHQISRAVPAAANAYIEAGQLQNGYKGVWVRVEVDAASFTVYKLYYFNVPYSQTGANYYTLRPVYDSGAFSGNDYALDYNQSTWWTTFRLRRVSGGNSGTAIITFLDGVGVTAYNDLSATGSGAAPTTSYGGYTSVSGMLRSIDVRAFDTSGLYMRDAAGTLGIYVENGGNVGIGTSAPQDLFHVAKGTLGFITIFRSGINGTANTLLAAGTFSKILTIQGVVIDGSTTGTRFDYIYYTSMGANSQNITLNGSTITFTFGTNGSLSVRVTAGAGVFNISATANYI